MIGLKDYQLAVEVIRRASEDPEDTLMIQLTHKEWACLTFGLILENMLFPELSDDIGDLYEKVTAVIDEQGFLPKVDAA